MAFRRLKSVPLPRSMVSETPCGKPARRYRRIELPNGMTVTWYGGGDQQVSRVKTLGMGGLFLSGSRAKPRHEPETGL